MELWIKPSELIRDPHHPVSVKIQDKMLEYHIFPVNAIRDAVEFPIWASSKSGYRPKGWERRQGREPDGVRRLHWSRHTYEPCPGDPEGKGATDWTCSKENRLTLARRLRDETDYNRIALYSWGFHCDYKDVNGFQLILSDGWEPVDWETFKAHITGETGRSAGI